MRPLYSQSIKDRHFYFLSVVESATSQVLF